jgi:hypothetical protein
MEPLRAVNALSGAVEWSREGEVCTQVVTDLHRFDEEQDPDPH